MRDVGKGFYLVFVAILVFSNLMINVSAKVTEFSAPTSNPAPTASSSPTASTPTPSPISTSPAPTIIYPKPSVPEFNLSLSTSENNTIELVIKNQAFTPYTDPSGIYIYLVYNVRASTNNGNWTELYFAEDGYPRPSNSDYTILLFVIENSTYDLGSIMLSSRLIGVFPANGQVDFQVEAMIGYRSRGPFLGGLMPYIFNGETSGWSNTQTTNINEAPNTPTQTPYLPPRNPPHLEPIDYLLPISVVLTIVIVLSLLIHRRHRNRRPFNSS